MSWPDRVRRSAFDGYMHCATIELSPRRNVLVGARNRQGGCPSRIVIFLPVSPGISRLSPAYLAECFGLFVFGRAASTMAGGSREGRTTIMLRFHSGPGHFDANPISGLRQPLIAALATHPRNARLRAVSTSRR